MNELTKHEDRFPVLIEELHEWILVGKERLNAHKAKIRAIEKVKRAQAAKEAALSDAQDLADILLDAEVKLGEMLEPIKPKYVGSIPGTHVPKQEKTLPNGIDKKQSHYAQTLAKHKEVVEEAKADAREEGRIVTSAEVIGQIQRTKQKKEDPNKIIRQEYDDAFELYRRAVSNVKGINWRSVPKTEVLTDLETLNRIIGE